MPQVTGLLLLLLAVWLGNASLQHGVGEEVEEELLAERETTEARRRRPSQDNLIVAVPDTGILSLSVSCSNFIFQRDKN